MQDILKALGLSDTEIKAYIALLPLGTVPASALGNRLQIPRPTAKYTCEQLQKKGLLTAQIKNNTFYYTAKEPEVLYSMLNAEKKELEKKEVGLGQIMGQLKQLFNTEVQLPKVRFFEGPDNIKKMFEDVLMERKPLYGCSYVGGNPPIIDQYLREIYIPERKRLHFPAWMLFNDNEAVKDYRRHDSGVNRISLLVPEADFPFDICFHIYGEKVAFYSYKKDEFIGIIIEDRYIRNMQLSLFKMAWNFARMLPANKSYAKVSLD